MAIENNFQEEVPVQDDSRAMVVAPEPTRDDEIRNAAEILVMEEGVLLDDEIDQEVIPQQLAFDDNLADFIDESELSRISGGIISAIEADKESRSEWEKIYIEGLKYLGMKFDATRSQPFEGASGVIHPILAEAVTQFQAQAYKELLPAKGPVKTEVIGARTVEAEMQAERVQDFMNYYIMNVMEEYDPELDMLLFNLPVSGSCFKKVYFDMAQGRARSSFIPPEDLIVPYEANDLSSAERVTHVVKMSTNEIRKGQLTGIYTDVELSTETYNSTGEIQEQIDDIEGLKPSHQESRDRTVFETHTLLDIEGFEDVGEDGEPTGLKLPYIVTIDEDTTKVLAIRRNYEEQDPSKSKINYFVQYKFLSGLGFYGLGLSHMIGGIAKASTSILRQLIDAGTLANLPAGFKARGMRIRDEANPLQPGEFRDIDTTGASLKENLIPLPIKEPSNVLMSLLGMLVDSGKRFASIGDMNVGDMNQAMPVGTTVALLERGTKVMSAIHKRLHYAQRMEFKLLAKVFAEYLPPDYPYATGSGPQEVKGQDFSNSVNIIPVSDPNIFSQSQRITMAQELLQMVQSNPEIHGEQGTYEAYRRMYAALGVDDVNMLLQPPTPPPEPQPKGSGLENLSLLQLTGATVFQDQDHEAHVNSHRALFMSKLVQDTPQLQGALIGHCMEHLQFIADEQAEKQMPPEMAEQVQQLQQMSQPQEGQPPAEGQIPPEQAQQFLQQIETEKARIAAPIMAQLSSDLMASLHSGGEQDPLVSIREKELDLREQEMQSDNAQFAARQAQREREQEDSNREAQERFKIQQGAAEDKMDIAIRRLDQQARLKLLDMNQKNRG